jgi:Icc-related predicted phosphoesterase
MKLVVTSDCHGQLSQARIPHGDVLILAGDILANRSGDPDIDAAIQLNAIRDLDAYCGTLGFKHVLMIAGNHDWVFERYKGAHNVLKHIFYLEDSGTEINGVKFWGSPHQPWFYDWAFNHPRNGPALAHYWSLIPDDTDVLITHGPPYGILDLPFGKGEPAGCELLRKRVLDVNPRVHIFGHIHGSYGTQQIGETLFVNACLCNERYDPVNPPHVIDLWPDGRVES